MKYEKKRAIITSLTNVVIITALVAIIKQFSVPLAIFFAVAGIVLVAIYVAIENKHISEARK